MKLLRDCGVVKARKEGRWMHYSLNREVAGALATLLEELG